MKDYYEILQVHPKASLDVIKKAYITLAKKYHPDTTKLDAETAQQKMKDLNEAYAVLSDATLRADYDQKLNNQTNNQESPNNNEKEKKKKKEPYQPQYTSPTKEETPKSNKWLYIGIAAAVIIGFFFFGSDTKPRSSNTSNIAKSTNNAQQSVSVPTAPVAPVYVTKYVNSYDVNVRTDPSTNNPPLGVYNVPEPVKVISQDGQWTRVQRNDGNITYIFSKFLSDDPNVAQTMATKEITRKNLAHYIDKKDEFDRQIAAFSNEVNGIIGKPNGFYQAVNLANRMWSYTTETIPYSYNSLKNLNVRPEDQNAKNLLLNIYLAEQDRVGYMYNGLKSYINGGSYKQGFSKGSNAYDRFQEMNQELNTVIY